MKTLIKNQQGSFLAEMGAVIASISILSLIGTTYMDTMQGRAQVTEGFVMANILVKDVNAHFAESGSLGIAADTSYLPKNLYGNVAGGENSNFVGRYVLDAQSFSNGVVFVQMNPFFDRQDSTDTIVDLPAGLTDATGDTQGRSSNVAAAVAGELIIMVPSLDIPTSSVSATSLSWTCYTTIDAAPFGGADITDAVDGVYYEQDTYAPGCIVISKVQANCLHPDDTNFFDTTNCTGSQHTAPELSGATAYLPIS